jgi:hypothetical protein
MNFNAFMIDLMDKLKSTGITENSANAYLKYMYILNNKKTFNNLAFLKRYDNVNSILDGYSENSRSTMLGAILAVLKLYQDKSTYKKPYKIYLDLKQGIKKILNEKSNQKTEKQKENWISWEQVLEVKNNLKQQVEQFKNKKKITGVDYDLILQYFVLSLFADLKPRRNKDYQECYIVKQYNDEMSKDKNYLDLATDRFIFNQYKTAKTYGQQIVDFADNTEFKEALKLYLKFHPLYKKQINKSARIPLLVKYTGSPLSAINDLTRVLYRVFGGRPITSQLLRNIYLTEKYGDTLAEMKQTAKDMAHSTQEAQKTYIKED